MDTGTETDKANPLKSNVNFNDIDNGRETIQIA